MIRQPVKTFSTHEEAVRYRDSNEIENPQIRRRAKGFTLVKRIQNISRLSDIKTSDTQYSKPKRKRNKNVFIERRTD